MRLSDVSGRSYIYIVGPDIGPKKIGIAKDFSKRLSQYKTHNVQNVKSLFAKNCPREKAEWIERTVHKRLSQHHDHGEWFNVTKDEAKSVILQAMNEARQPNVNIDLEDDRHRGLGAYIQFRLFGWPMSNRLSQGARTVACIRFMDDRYILSFGGENSSDEANKLAPEKYRTNFRDLTKCIAYAEEKIFDAIEKASRARTK